MKNFVVGILVVLLLSCSGKEDDKERIWKEVSGLLSKEILARAEADLEKLPVTVTSFIAERSVGGLHDFYSEGDYWWPDTLHPEAPYIRRDGETNPDNFVAHRHAMIRFSTLVGELASAYLLTADRKYADHAFSHVKAWFVNPETRMNPSLEYAQAIKGIATGRGIGIIDGIHLVEVARALSLFEKEKLMPKEDEKAVKSWFSDYLTWLTTHPYGKSEMKEANNHGTCWVMQVAAFAAYTGQQDLLELCRKRYKEVLLPRQMAADGSFPLELKRTKPYGYSLFNLDAMAAVCHILSDNREDLWNYTLPDGRNINKAVDFLRPYVADKAGWKWKPDVMYWEEWPVAQPFLLLSAWHRGDFGSLEIWSRLEHFPENEEVIRNLPLRNPLLWIVN